MIPGSTIATRTLNGFASCANDSLSASNANFDAVYAAMGELAMRPATDATLWPALPKARAVAMPIPELVPVIRTDAMDGLLRDLLPPRHGRATRHRASGFRAFELFCNMGRGRRTARAASEPDTRCATF